MNITKADFLVLTQKAGKEYRWLTGRHGAEETAVRAVVLGAANDVGSRLVREERTARGIERTLLVRLHGLPDPFELVLVWGVRRNGRPKVSPDGTRWTVFLTAFRTAGPGA